MAAVLAPLGTLAPIIVALRLRLSCLAHFQKPAPTLIVWHADLADHGLGLKREFALVVLALIRRLRLLNNLDEII